MDLTDRRVLITGASRGIGEAMARRFAEAGARGALVARSADALRALADDVGGTAHPADLADADVVAGLIERVEAEGGPVDGPGPAGAGRGHHPRGAGADPHRPAREGRPLPAHPRLL